MAEKLQMLALSPTMEKGIITKWLKEVGDKVAEGDVICEVETDKATMDYESMNEGVLLKIVVQEGGEAAVGDEIAVIGEEGEEVEQSSEKQDKPKQEPEEKQEEQEDKEDKDKSEDKEKQPQNQQPEEKIEESQEQKKESEPEKSKAEKSKVKSTPLARKLAKERGIDIAKIDGTGPAGRVVVRDVEQVIGGKKESSEQSEPKKATVALSDEEIKVSPMRKAIAERLSQSKFSAPHYYLKVAVNARELITTRSKLKLDSAKKISFNSFLIKLAAEAIKHNPMINSSWADDKIVKHGSVDVGLAVAIENGLITPIVRDCGNKGIMAIEKELAELIDLAKKGKLKSEQYEGATFTISNLGSFGIDEFTAIINPPGSAILAVGKIGNQVVADDAGNISAEPMMKLTLSCDHRIIDGAVGAAFMADLKHFIEEPISAFY